MLSQRSKSASSHLDIQFPATSTVTPFWRINNLRETLVSYKTGIEFTLNLKTYLCFFPAKVDNHHKIIFEIDDGHTRIGVLLESVVIPLAEPISGVLPRTGLNHGYDLVHSPSPLHRKNVLASPPVGALKKSVAKFISAYEHRDASRPKNRHANPLSDMEHPPLPVGMLIFELKKIIRHISVNPF